MAKEHEKPIEETVDDKEPEKEGKGPEAPVSAGLQSAEMLDAMGQQTAKGGSQDPAAAQSQALQDANNAASGSAEPQGPSPAAKAIADKVPRNEKQVEDYMDKKENFGTILIKYKGREHYVDEKLDSYLSTAESLASEAEEYYGRGDTPPPDLVKKAKANLNEASTIAAEKESTEFDELRGVYTTMGKVIVPRWQQELKAGEVAKKECAQLACMHRNAFKVHIRNHQNEDNLIQIMQLRNRAVYNHPVGPTYDGLMEEHKEAGKSEEEGNDEIIRSASRSNKGMNNLRKKK